MVLVLYVSARRILSLTGRHEYSRTKVLTKTAEPTPSEKCRQTKTLTQRESVLTSHLLVQTALRAAGLDNGALRDGPQPSQTTENTRLAGAVVARQEQRRALLQLEVEFFDENVARWRGNADVLELNDGAVNGINTLRHATVDLMG